jgi:GNAT superfamily N-acetyltransferase
VNTSFARAADAAILADQVEAEANADMFAAAPAVLRERFGVGLRRLGAVTLLMASRMPATIFNRAIGLGLEQAASAADVRAIANDYEREGIRTWWLHWNPFAQPSGFARELRAMGFTEASRRTWAKFLRGRTAAPGIATDLVISPTTADEAPQVMACVVQAFGMPPVMAQWLAALHGRPRWHMYSVKEADTPVGGACLFIDGERAWLGVAAVLESHRRRGGQGALMARRIDDAIAAGCRYIVTETGEPVGDEPNPSYSNMKRCGFEVVASRLNFEAPASVISAA